MRDGMRDGVRVRVRERQTKNKKKKISQNNNLFSDLGNFWFCTTVPFTKF